jgi:aspartokinase-like uncharacterized kinase
MTLPCVVKVGGSLLDLLDLAERLQRVVERVRHDGHTPVLLAGGGRRVDAIRVRDRQLGLDPQTAHDLALEAMTHNARILARLLEAHLTADFDSRDSSGHKLMVVDPKRWLERDEQRHGNPLPRTWDVTSDTIAARLALRLDAPLLLLKSRGVPAGCDLAQAARLGLVDPCFPDAADLLSQVSYINLRGAVYCGPKVLSSRTTPWVRRTSSGSAASRDSR